MEKLLEKYATLALETGVNLQSGQTLVISAPLTANKFVHTIVEKAYKAGAKSVYVDWVDETLTYLKLKHGSEETLKEFPTWKAKGFEEMAENNAAFLTIYAPNPELLKEMDPKRVAMVNKTNATALDDFSQYKKKDKVSWSIIAYPTKEWAEKVFPELDEETAFQKLWNLIFNATRVDQDDPIAAWKKHRKQLTDKVHYLNEKNFKKLHYKGTGTDLSIELPVGHKWVGGGSENENGDAFIPNMPTEEVFTVPLKSGVNGTVASTKPLNYGGNIIDNFSLTFENGKIVKYEAEQGYEILKGLLETDEGARYLGEIALVPDDSPISNSDVIFYNTLFDENASCHLAIGAAYPFCLDGGTKMSKEELEKNEINTSLTHVDFMIGSGELQIDGETESGETVAVFRKGNWAF